MYKSTNFLDASIRDKDKQELLRVIREEISDKAWILKPNSEADAIDILPPTISIAPKSKYADHTEFLDIIGFKTTKVYSKFEQGYVDNNGKNIELLDILNKAPDSCVYLGVHLYTLALLAVSCTSCTKG